MDYSRNSIYFTGNLSGAGCFGVLLLLAGIGTIWSGDASSGIVGLIIVIVGSALLALGYSSSGSGMTDTEYDSAIAKYAESLKSRATRNLELMRTKLTRSRRLFWEVMILKVQTK